MNEHSVLFQPFIVRLVFVDIVKMYHIQSCLPNQLRKRSINSFGVFHSYLFLAKNEVILRVISWVVTARMQWRNWIRRTVAMAIAIAKTASLVKN